MLGILSSIPRPIVVVLVNVLCVGVGLFFGFGLCLFLLCLLWVHIGFVFPERFENSASLPCRLVAFCIGTPYLLFWLRCLGVFIFLFKIGIIL